MASSTSTPDPKSGFSRRDFLRGSGAAAAGAAIHQQTTAALARFRATSQVGGAEPAIAGLDLRGFLDRLARDAGFHNGLADVLSSVAGWLGAKRF